MKRSLQEVVELLAFALIVLIVGTGLLWLAGWLLGLLGALFKLVAGLVWMLLRYLIPIAFIAGAVYFLVRLAQDRDRPRQAQTAPAAAPGAQPTAAETPPPPPTATANDDRPLEEQTVEEAKAEGARIYDAAPESEPEAPVEQDLADEDDRKDG